MGNTITLLHKADEMVENSPGYLVRRLECSERNTCFVYATLSNVLAMNVLRNYFVQSVDDSFGPLHASLRKLFLETSHQFGPLHASLKKLQRLGTCGTINDNDIDTIINLTPLFHSMCSRYPAYASGKGASPLLFIMDLIIGLSTEELSSRLSRGVVSDDAAFVDGVFHIKIANKSVSSSAEDTAGLALCSSIPYQEAKSKDTCSVSIESCLNNPRIKKAPTVLMISMVYHMKFNGRLDFGETLDLKPYIDPTCIDRDDTYKYRLIGILEIIILSRNLAHAISFVRGTDSKGHCVWYHVNDTKITKLPVKEVLARKPTLLFYEKY